jgi:hypothetical protein
MPGRTGYEICQYLKMSPRHRHVRVILTAGVMETLDAAAVARVEADASLTKPFEASALIAAVKPLAEAAQKDRAAQAPREPGAVARVPAVAAAPFVAVVDEEQVRAAVTVALDASMAVMVDEIAKRVLVTLATRKPAAAPDSAPAVVHPPAPAPAAVRPPAPEPAFTSAPIEAAQPAPPVPMPPPAPMEPRIEPVRRVTPLRHRTGSILGLDISPPESESSERERE